MMPTQFLPPRDELRPKCDCKCGCEFFVKASFDLERLEELCGDCKEGFHKKAGEFVSSIYQSRSRWVMP